MILSPVKLEFTKYLNYPWQMMIRTVDELVDALGGSGATAKITGVGVSAVSNWRAFGVIPPEYFLIFGKVTAERGIIIDPIAIFGFKRQVA